MKNLRNVLFGAFGVLALTLTSASATIICNVGGDCWHATEKYDYRPDYGVTVYKDYRYFLAGDGEYRWHKHEERGAWNDMWTRLQD